MKVFIIALIFVVVVVASEAKRCRLTSECDENECCAIKPGWIWRGRCKPLGEVDDHCSRDEDEHNGAHLYDCPCESGLECRAEKVIKSIFDKDVEYRINERCVDPNNATTEAEVTTDDGGEVTIEAE